MRKVREMVLKAGAKLVSRQCLRLELDNGSRVLALPGTDDIVRGLTVDGWIVADEAARLSGDLIGSLASDAGPSSAGAVGHVVDRMEPH